jgi:hypothetical protein
MKDLDDKLILERYKLISEIPASLEFMSDDPEITSRLHGNLKPVSKPASANERRFDKKSIAADKNAWSSEKARALMKSTVEQTTAKGLDRRRKEQGKKPLLWRIIDANLEETKLTSDGEDYRSLITKSEIEQLIKFYEPIRNKLTSPTGITVIMTPSGQDDRSGMMAFSAWIRSHKCGHAILDTPKNYNIRDNISKVLKEYYDLFKESLRLYPEKEKYPILNNLIDKTPVHELERYYRDVTNFYSSLFTFGSARNKKLLVSDMIEELVAQLIQTGRITINKMIDEKVMKQNVQDLYDYYGKSEWTDKIEELKNHRTNMLNIEEYIANQIVTAIENCIGTILYDII